MEPEYIAEGIISRKAFPPLSPDGWGGGNVPLNMVGTYHLQMPKNPQVPL